MFVLDTATDPDAELVLTAEEFMVNRGVFLAFAHRLTFAGAEGLVPTQPGQQLPARTTEEPPEGHTEATDQEGNKVGILGRLFKGKPKEELTPEEQATLEAAEAKEKEDAAGAAQGEGNGKAGVDTDANSPASTTNVSLSEKPDVGNMKRGEIVAMAENHGLDLGTLADNASAAKAAEAFDTAWVAKHGAPTPTE